jgi:excisionase family DNA binding protein
MTFYTENESRKYLNITRTTLRRHRQAGKITAIKAGAVLLYSRESLDQWRDEFYGGLRKRRYARCNEAATQ